MDGQTDGYMEQKTDKNNYKVLPLSEGDNDAKHLKHSGRILGLSVIKNLHFGELIFGRKIKSMDSNKNMKFTHKCRLEHDENYRSITFHLTMDDLFHFKILK